MAQLSDEELIALLGDQLPDLLERRPELQERVYAAFFKVFATRREVAAVLAELREFRAAVDQRFDAVDQRSDSVGQRFQAVDRHFGDFRAEVARRFDEVAQRFDKVDRSIDRLGSRWGIRNEALFRDTIATLLERSFGARVERVRLANEEFDVVITDGAHILVEIGTTVRRDILARLQRKREAYRQHTGIEPARVLLAAGAIHPDRAQALQRAGIEVVVPEDEEA